MEADSGNLLQTIYLDNKGERRFTKDWYVPQDKTGSGYYIIISISVYTDSAYTTKAVNYADEDATYLIQERLTRSDMPFGGGADVDYKRVKKIIEEVFETNKKPDNEAVNQEIEKLNQNIQGVKEAIKAIQIPEAKEINYEVILNGLADIKNSFLEAIENIPEPEKADLSPIVEANRQENASSVERMRQAVAAVISALSGQLQEISGYIQSAEANSRQEAMKKAEELKIELNQVINNSGLITEIFKPTIKNKPSFLKKYAQTK